MKKVLIFGKDGQVSWELQRSMAIHGQVKVCSSREVNFENNSGIAKVINDYRPTHIVNASAYTAVDKAESEPDKAFQINAAAVGVIAEESKRIGAAFVHYSTDYVFDGTKTQAYSEEDATHPLSVYGKSKLQGEQFVREVAGNSVIFRVSWIYGNHGSNFYKTMLRLGAERSELKVVGDQFGSPTWSRHIADVASQFVSKDAFSGVADIYHISPQDKTSWSIFAQTIFNTYREMIPQNELKVETVVAIESKDYPSPVKRPANSQLSGLKLQKATGITLPHWAESLKLVIADRN